MAFRDQLTQEPVRLRISTNLAEHWKLMLVSGLLLEILGVLAFAMPLLSTLAVDIFVGWLFFIGGVVRVATLLRARHWPGYWWSLTSGILAIVVGTLLVMSPWRGMLTLTMILAVLFLVEGVSAVFAGLAFRHHSRNWGWLLFSGFVDLVLVFLIWWGWPGTAAWAIGVLVGVNLFLIGLSLMMLSFAVRR